MQADFIVGNTGTIYTKQYEVNPNSRFNIWVDEEEMTPGNKPFKTGNTDVSVRIRSLNGVPLIVERAMWWPGAFQHLVRGAQLAGLDAHREPLGLAEGENGGAIGWNTYILVANTGSTAGTISGSGCCCRTARRRVLTGLPVAAQSRTTYYLRDLLEAAGLPTDTQAGVLIESEGHDVAAGGRARHVPQRERHHVPGGHQRARHPASVTEQGATFHDGGTLLTRAAAAPAWRYVIGGMRWPRRLPRPSTLPGATRIRHSPGTRCPT